MTTREEGTTEREAGAVRGGGASTLAARSYAPEPHTVSLALGELIEQDLPWRVEAACRNASVDLFFPIRGQSTSRAKALCRRCPVRPECLEYALSHDLPGVWGGLSAQERQDLEVGPVAGERPRGPGGSHGGSEALTGSWSENSPLLPAREETVSVSVPGTPTPQALTRIRHASRLVVTFAGA